MTKIPFNKTSQWTIRLCQKEDLPFLQAIYDQGRQIQLETKNLNQWPAGYPGPVQLLSDFEAGHLYVLEDKQLQQILAVMALIPGVDPTYLKIDGQWLEEETSYVTIHRIAALKEAKGAGQTLIKWVLDHYPNVRIDTHHDNQPMKHLMGKLGFHYCGVIYLENGDPRDAYQSVRK